MKRKVSIRSSALIGLLSLVCMGIWSFEPNKDRPSETSMATKRIYCEVVYDSRIDPKSAFSAEYEYIKKLWVNYGNNINYPNAKSEYSFVESFEENMDALNYMGSQGWKLIDHYRLELGNGFTQDVYLMEKEN